MVAGIVTLLAGATGPMAVVLGGGLALSSTAVAMQARPQPWPREAGCRSSMPELGAAAAAHAGQGRAHAGDTQASLRPDPCQIPAHILRRLACWPLFLSWPGLQPCAGLRRSHMQQEGMLPRSCCALSSPAARPWTHWVMALPVQALGQAVPQSLLLRAGPAGQGRDRLPARPRSLCHSFAPGVHPPVRAGAGVATCTCHLQPYLSRNQATGRTCCT